MKISPRKPPKPRTDLSSEARQLWNALVRDFAIDDEAGRLLLDTALRAFDRMRQAEAQLARDGITIKDRWGQTKAHPCLVAERDARAGLLNALRQLKLDPSVVTGKGVDRRAGA